MQLRLSRTVFMTSLLAALSASYVGQASAASDASAQPASAYGHVAKAPSSRSIEITPQTRHINVTQLETITFKLGDKRVNWTFDTLNTQAFPLSSIVPGAGEVTVYVAPSPLWQGR